MALDTLLLTVLLALSGGPSNPFSVLYLVDVALGAVVLTSALTWALLGLVLALHGSTGARHATVAERGNLPAFTSMLGTE